MIIGIDGNEANVKERVGVGKYSFELLQKFKEFRISNFEFRIYLKDEPLADLPKETDWWKYKVVGPKKLWTQIGLPLALYKDSLSRGRRINVFFTPAHYAPRFCPCPRVISIMDLSFLHYPEMFRKQDLWQLKNWTAYSVKKATKILTISEASKSDIIKYYQVPGDKVVVTYPGDNMNVKCQMSNVKSVREKYGVEGDYILSVGTLQPRKNFGKLIEAFSRLKNISLSQGVKDITPLRCKGGMEKLSLVIVGKKGWMYEEILGTPKRLGIENEVRFLDYVPDEDLPALYQNAKCFVLVSLYEGFGLPVLEAMNYGVPVVVSNISSLPEIVGEAGILVDPYNVHDIAKRISSILSLSKEEREKLIEKGLVQSKKFSWEKCAKETLKVLKEVSHS
ncbi:glycosyltransferase family 4 protein [Candidatus Gottesmanbacteria bacterium]|nr:glycosyltransferase family 4 protein [Candidatus Gottesmanbacteria bacterium]